MPNLALNSGYQNRKLRTAKWGSEMGFNGLFAAQQFKGTHVAVGSKAALTAPKTDFRFTPESGLNSDIAPSPKSAMCGQVGDQPTVIPGIARRRPSTHLATSSGRRMGIRSTRLETRDAGPSSRRKRAALVECHADPLFPAPYDVAAQPSGTKLAAPATRRLATVATEGARPAFPTSLHRRLGWGRSRCGGGNAKSRGLDESCKD